MKKSLILALTSLTLACGSKSEAEVSSECTRQAELFEACYDIWETEYSVYLGCLETASPSWYDENGSLRLEDEDVLEDYQESVRDDCETFDDFYDSCVTQYEARLEAIEAAGNTVPTVEDPELVQLMDELNCVGFLEYTGIIEAD